MRIDSPKVSNLTFQTGSNVADSSFTGSFSGSFTGVGNFTGLTADSVEYANILNRPAGLVSGSASQARAQIGSVIGTDVQAYHANLADISNLNPADGSFIVGAGSTFVTETGATVRTSLGLGSLATLNTDSALSSVDLSGNSSYTFANIASKPAGLVSGSASQARSQIGVDAAGTDNSTDVTLTGTPDYLTISGQVITIGEVDLTTDVTGILPLADGGTGADNAADARSALGVDAAGTDNSTDVTLANTNYLSISGQEITGGTVPVGSGGTGATTAAGARSALGVDAAGTDNSTDVTLAGTPDYITISGQTITRNQIDLTADVTGDLPISEGGTGASTAAAARSNLGVDAAGTDNSTDVTLAGSRDYLTISGQEITVGQIDISDDTNLAVSDTSGQTGIDMSLTGDTLSATASGLGTGATVQFANLTISGDLTVNGATTSINSTNLDVTDKLISLNRGGSTAASADGGGLFISGANESLTWDNGNSRFTFSDDLNVEGNLTLSGTVDGVDIAARDHDAVTLGNTNYLSISGQEITGGTVPVGSGGTGATTAAAARTALGVDAAGTDNSTNVTLAGSYDYLTISGQTITRNQIDWNTDISNKPTYDNYSSWTIQDGDSTTYTITSGDTLQIASGTGITSNFTADDVLTITNTITNNNQLTNGAGYITSGGSISGNAATATKLATARTIAGVNFDGTANISLNNNAITNGAGYTTYTANQGLDNDDNVHFEGLMVGQTTGATANTIRCVGDIVAYYSSDQQFKDNVETLEGSLEKIKAIRGVRFDWNDKQDVHEGHDIGVIAQEVEAVLPELVHYREHNDSKAVDYVKLTAVLIEAVKELSAKVDELEGKCNC